MTTISLLRDSAEGAGVSVTELARRSGVSRAATYRILDGTTSPRLDDLRELFLALGVDISLAIAPIHDLDAAAAARVILGDSLVNTGPGVLAWIDRLTRLGRGDPAAIVRAAGQATSVFHDPDAIGLRAGNWDVDRLVSAGRASQKLWALSGWAALNAMGQDVDAHTIFWTEDVRLSHQLLADTMTTTSLDRADIILRHGDASVFELAVDIDAVILVNSAQALIDCVGLGGAAETAALRLIGSAR